jgi:hypothetical protein
MENEKPKTVAQKYIEQTSGSKKVALERLMSQLWRNHPDWPSTFSECPEKCGGYGRGGDTCAFCAERAIAEIIKNPIKARRFHQAIIEVRELSHEIRDSIN